MCSKWNLSSPSNLLLFLCFLSQVKVPLFTPPGLSQEPRDCTVLSFNLSTASWPYIFPIKHHLTTSTYHTSWICLYSWIYLEYIYFNISRICLFFYFSNVTALVQVLMNSCLNLQHPLNCSLEPKESFLHTNPVKSLPCLKHFSDPYFSQDNVWTDLVGPAWSDSFPLLVSLGRFS